MMWEIKKKKQIKKKFVIAACFDWKSMKVKTEPDAIIVQKQEGIDPAGGPR